MFQLDPSKIRSYKKSWESLRKILQLVESRRHNSLDVRAPRDDEFCMTIQPLRALYLLRIRGMTLNHLKLPRATESVVFVGGSPAKPARKQVSHDVFTLLSNKWLAAAPSIF